ncbi:MAG: glycosyltransferase [Candidatus Omnitrophota bacterium]
MTRKKALIFYISRYSGHFHAANAIEKGLLEFSKDIEIKKINALGYTNPILEKVLNRAYMEVIKNKPEIWERIYDNHEVMQKAEKIREALHKFNMPKMKKLIEAYSPDAIFCTQAFPCGMAADYKKKFKKNILLVGILTDYAPHSYWIFDEVDFYITPSDDITEELAKKGVPSHKIKAYGIPVDPKFQNEKDPQSIRKGLALEEKNETILIMGGTQGLGAIEDVVESLLSDREHNYQLLVVAGANKKLYKRMSKIKLKSNNNLRVFSYVDNIDELMQISAVIISKAGGMTIAETITKRLPMVIVDPLPGHERRNTDYLVKKGAAVEIKEHSQIHKSVNELFDSEGALNKMRENIEKLSTKDSALNIAKLAFN